MITEDLLERGLGAAAAEYDVPAGAIERLREQLDGPAEPPVSERSWRPAPRTWLLATAAAVVAIVGISFAIGSSGGSPSNESATRSPVATPGIAKAAPPGLSGGSAASSAGGTAGLAPSVPAPSTAAGAASGATGSGTGAATVPDSTLATTAIPDRVVKTGDIDLSVGKNQVSHVLDRLSALATLENGFVSNSQTTEAGADPGGQVTLRVPAASFDATISQIRKLGVKVVSLQTSSQDVTSQYVDLQARIKALEDTRAAYLALLAKATTIGDTLAVEQHVTDVQTQIEQLQGQQNVLADQSSLATLTVTVDQQTVVPVVKKSHSSGISRAFHRSVDRFVNGIEAIVGALGTILLVLLIVAFFGLLGWFGYRKLRRILV